MFKSETYRRSYDPAADLVVALDVGYIGRK